jgi:hypothetical protein
MGWYCRLRLRGCQGQAWALSVMQFSGYVPFPPLAKSPHPLAKGGKRARGVLSLEEVFIHALILLVERTQLLRQGIFLGLQALDISVARGEFALQRPYLAA